MRCECYSVQRVEVRDAAKHLVMHRSVHTTKNYPASAITKLMVRSHGLKKKKNLFLWFKQIWELDIIHIRASTSLGFQLRENLVKERKKSRVTLVHHIYNSKHK